MKKITFFALFVGLVLLFTGCNNMNSIMEPTTVNSSNSMSAMANELIDLRVTTDKMNYESGETITVTFENLGDPVLLVWGGCKGKFSSNVYQITENGYKRMVTMDPSLVCPCVSWAGPFETGEVGYFTWNQIYYGYYSDGSSGSLPWTQATVLPDQHQIGQEDPIPSHGFGNLAPEGYYIVVRNYYLGTSFEDIQLGGSMTSNVFTIGIPETGTEIIDTVIENIPDDAIEGPADQRIGALQNKLDEVQQLIDEGKYEIAIAKLQNDIRPKTDGCFGGNPNNDWITDCEVQTIVIGLIDNLIAQLEELL